MNAASAKAILSGLLLIVGALTIIQFMVVQDLNRMIGLQSETIALQQEIITDYHERYGDAAVLFGTQLLIPKEVHDQDWVYVEKGGSTYDRHNTKLIDTNHSEVLIQFPSIIDDGFLYYDALTNYSDDDIWYQIRFDTRRSVTFNHSIHILDNFSDANNAFHAIDENDEEVIN